MQAAGGLGGGRERGLGGLEVAAQPGAGAGQAVTDARSGEFPPAAALT